MYLRTTKRRNADGSEVRYFQLAENVWDPVRGYAVAKTVYNFGRADPVDGDMLRRLAKSIWPVVGDAEQLQERPEISVHDSWPLGGVWVLEQLWKELGIDKLLRAQRKQHKKDVVDRFERALFAMVANRALSLGSKLYCWEQWLQEEAFLPSAACLELHDFYLGMDFLEEHKAELEKAVFFSVADLMNVDVDLIFYDTTSLHFEVDEEDEVSLAVPRLTPHNASQPMVLSPLKGLKNPDYQTDA